MITIFFQREYDGRRRDCRLVVKPSGMCNELAEADRAGVTRYVDAPAEFEESCDVGCVLSAALRTVFAASAAEWVARCTETRQLYPDGVVRATGGAIHINVGLLR